MFYLGVDSHIFCILFSLDACASLFLVLLCSSCSTFFCGYPCPCFTWYTASSSLSCVQVFVILSFLQPLCTMFKSRSGKSLNFAFVHSLHMPDIIQSCIMLSFKWSKLHFPACVVMFVKKEKNISLSFWSLSLKK